MDFSILKMAQTFCNNHKIQNSGKKHLHAIQLSLAIHLESIIRRFLQDKIYNDQSVIKIAKYSWEVQSQQTKLNYFNNPKL